VFFPPPRASSKHIGQLKSRSTIPLLWRAHGLLLMSSNLLLLLTTSSPPFSAGVSSGYQRISLHGRSG
jgi:hypothetical protein